jgi:hypothetical protein
MGDVSSFYGHRQDAENCLCWSYSSLILLPGNPSLRLPPTAARMGPSNFFFWGGLQQMDMPHAAWGGMHPHMAGKPALCWPCHPAPRRGAGWQGPRPYPCPSHPRMHMADWTVSLPHTHQEIWEAGGIMESQHRHPAPVGIEVLAPPLVPLSFYSAQPAPPAGGGRKKSALPSHLTPAGERSCGKPGIARIEARRNRPF